MPRRALLVGLGASLLAACQPTAFTTTVKGETVLRGDALSGLFSAFPPIGSFSGLDFSANQDFKNQGITRSQVSSAKATEVTLRIVSPGTQDFRFLDNLAFYASAGGSEAQVADKQDISKLDLPAPNPTLRMDVKGTELRSYVTAPSMSVLVRGQGHSPPQDTRVEASVTFLVEFKLF